MTENKADPLRYALQRIAWLDPNAPIGDPPDPQYFIRQAQGIAREALASAPQPAAPLGGRDAIDIALRSYFRSLSAPIYTSSDGVPRIYYAGISLDGLIDAILAAIPQDRAADPQRLREVLGAFYNTVGVMKSVRNGNSKLMNIWSDDMKAVEDVVLFLEHLRDATTPILAAIPQERGYTAALENLREAWTALAMIRETIETLGPIGAVRASEHLDGPTFMHEADTLVAGIRALAGKETGR